MLFCCCTTYSEPAKNVLYTLSLKFILTLVCFVFLSQINIEYFSALGSRGTNDIKFCSL